jgi:sugar/nucleoside kinase (ribokinase family)
VEELKSLGVEVVAIPSKNSTCLCLEYSEENPDLRTISVMSRADPFRPEDVISADSRCFLIGASMRGEVPCEVLEALSKKDSTVSLDVQGFIRVLRNGVLVHEQWPEMESVLSMVDVLKTDAVEAQALTGKTEIRDAAKMLHSYGPSEIVLTHRDGLLVFAGGVYYEQRFYPKKAAGRSGRGDTCVAAYMARRLVAPPDEAADWAAAVTSLKLESEGPFRRNLEDVLSLINLHGH